MSDEEEIGAVEASEVEQPRRRRRKLLDFVAPQTDGQEGDIAVEPAPTEPPKLLAQEPQATGVTGLVGKMMGRGKTMKEGRWAGKQHWVCTKCQWDTLDRDRARRHYC